MTIEGISEETVESAKKAYRAEVWVEGDSYFGYNIEAQEDGIKAAIQALLASGEVVRRADVEELVKALRNSNLELRTCFDNAESTIGREMIQMRMDSNVKALSKFTTTAKEA